MCSRFPLERVERIKYAGGEPRGIIAGTIRLASLSTPVRIYCTHWDVFDDSGELREDEARELAHFVAHNTRAGEVPIIVGDFNAMARVAPDQWAWILRQDAARGVGMPNTRAMDWLLGESDGGLVDAFATEGGAPPPISCWTLRRVDWILLSRACPLHVPWTARVIANTSSDHFPLVIDLHLREEDGEGDDVAADAQAARKNPRE